MFERALIANQTEENSSVGTFFARAAEFVRDFAHYSGRKGVLAAVYVGCGALLEGIGLVLLIPILAVVVDDGRQSGRLTAAAAHLFAIVGAETRFQRLALLLSIFAALMMVRAVVLSVRDVTLAELQIGFVKEKRSLITQRLAAARWDAVAKLRYARIAYLMSSDIQSIGGATNFLLQCTVSLTILISQCALAFILSPILASLAFGLLAVGGMALGFMMRRARDLGHFVTNANLSLMNSTAQFLGGIKLAVSQNLQDSFVAEFHSTLHKLTGRQVAYMRQRTNARLAATTLSALVAALAVLIGFGVLNVAPSLLIAVLFLLARMNGPAMQIQQGAQQFATSLPAYEKIKELEKELAAAQDTTIGAATDIPDGPIVFRAVGFSYAGENESFAQPVLCNVDVTIAPGSFVGVCGASGAGKTTFADLLVGLFPPQLGEISVGGIPLREAALNVWRNRVSYVSQDPFLFHDTVRRNLLWAAPQSSENDLWSALRLAGADQLVRRMAQGLDTIVGERGTLVSGGERQRLALARAILRMPRLLVLDEATNAIDIASEHEILQHLVALKPRPTIVMIAHRIESMSLCEHILILDAGRFVENGSAAKVC
jgi:ATP-binding cassette subfamily C protein